MHIVACEPYWLRAAYADARIERATSAVDQMSPASLLLACAGLYRFCTEWRAFYAKATPRLVAIVSLSLELLPLLHLGRVGFRVAS